MPRNLDPAKAPAQLLVDLSQLVKHDARSGIQRVVRSMHQALAAQPPAGYRVAAVYDAGGYYAYAQQYGATQEQATTERAAEDSTAEGNATAAPDPIRVRAGDIFLGLDLCPDQLPRNEALLASLRRHGVRLYFMLYDLVPLSHPAMFHESMTPWFQRWLDAVCRQADGVVCISRAVADELAERLEQQPPRRAAPLPIGYCHLGADLEASLPTSGSEAADLAVLEAIAGRPALLMVGTLEPRKMHAQALDAMELLWQQADAGAAGEAVDADTCLVIVGKPGWEVAQLQQRLRGHAELGRRLFWLERASDETLQQLYRRSAALLAASAAEGFGLPLIEAAQHSLPVIARNLPVFREVGGEHAWYFEAADGAALAQALQQWLALHRDGKAPPSSAMPYLTWRQSTQQMLEVLLGGRWYRRAVAELPAV